MLLKHMLLRGSSIAYASDGEGGAPAPAAAPEPASPALPAASADDGGALTFEQATQALLEPTYETYEPDEGDDSSGGEASQPLESAEQTDPVEGAGGAEPGEEQDPAPVAAPEAPAYWSREAKARFAELSPEMQAVVLAQEGPREQATAKAKADAQAAIDKASADTKGVQQLAEQLGTFLPEAIQTFKQRWGEPDWEATIRQYGSEQAALMRARYDRELGQLNQLKATEDQARREAHSAYVQTEWKELAKLDPVLAPDVNDPSKGSAERQKVTSYLLAEGIGRDAVANISAKELQIARKAMLWDAAEAATKAAGKTPATPNPKPAGPKPGARPGAGAGTPQQRASATVQSAFNARPSIENAVALLVGRGAR